MSDEITKKEVELKKIKRKREQKTLEEDEKRRADLAAIQAMEEEVAQLKEKRRRCNLVSHPDNMDYCEVIRGTRPDKGWRPAR